MAKRLKAMGSKRYKRGFNVTLHADLIERPLSWIKPRMIFVNSMSDLFHEKVPLRFIEKIFATMAACEQHIFQVLTKRSYRLRQLAPYIYWPNNVWMGVTVEDKDCMYRINDLVEVPANVRFLSCEPLLGPLSNLPLSGIDWVIVGGESGPHSRPMKAEWAEGIFKQCTEANVPFFFKQWGGTRKCVTGRMLKGRLHEEFPRGRVTSSSSRKCPKGKSAL
jgi:protein gp37